MFLSPSGNDQYDNTVSFELELSQNSPRRTNKAKRSPKRNPVNLTLDTTTDESGLESFLQKLKPFHLEVAD
jgi:hypothetical protein